MARGAVATRPGPRPWTATLRPEDDRPSPSVGLLLQSAMSEPMLRGMYPWFSMNQLNVSVSGTWEEWGREPFPAMLAAPDAYLVLAHPVREGHVVLATADPAEAATFYRAPGAQPAGGPDAGNARLVGRGGRSPSRCGLVFVELV
ncbi:DUF6193 family natural product biosynthesis protein [Streptomyces sp. WM6372]|uniref:DUF6193 family natural product biosynthesis protein n=1 Tax=Streptomyces sp. WM6372 TaxID=1415555 RepID=UPI003B63D592